MKLPEIKKLVEVIEEKNLSIHEVINLIKGDSNSQDSKETNSAEESFTLVVDYSLTLKEMIDPGQYDWIHDNITEMNFPIPTDLFGRQVSVLAKLFHFNRDISSEEVISEMEKVGYRPAILPELLALGEVQPDLQRQFPIITIGSVWRAAFGRRDVPALSVVRGERRLNLLWFFNADWHCENRFLAIRKGLLSYA